MKKHLILSIFFLYGLLFSVQAQSEKNLALIIGLGLQEHDKRLFDFPLKESLLDRQPQNFGTVQFNINLSKNIFKKSKLKILTGAGISMEVNQFERPFDHTYKKDDSSRVLRFTDRYIKSIVLFPFTSQYSLTDQIELSLNILPQFEYLTIASQPNNENNYYWWDINFHSIEFNPGVSYTLSHFGISLNWRAFQFKRIDNIIFNDIIRDSREDKKIESYNPFKIWLSFNYAIK